MLENDSTMCTGIDLYIYCQHTEHTDDSNAAKHLWKVSEWHTGDGIDVGNANTNIYYIYMDIWMTDLGAMPHTLHNMALLSALRE